MHPHLNDLRALKILFFFAFFSRVASLSLLLSFSLSRRALLLFFCVSKKKKKKICHCRRVFDTLYSAFVVYVREAFVVVLFVVCELNKNEREGKYS